VNLHEWEGKFEKDWPKGDPKKAGFLLSIIPGRTDWDEFLLSVKVEWKTWHDNLQSLPYCLLMLYGGLAFYEYDYNTFWPQFANAVGTDAFPANRQTEINHAFQEIAEELGLKINKGTHHVDYVGSAVWHIGIPLSLWGGFLDVCEWALWRDDWKTLPGEEWAESIKNRVGGRPRLCRFLINNREVASVFIKDMLDAREILMKDSSLSLADLAQACLTRTEYFEDVPETADFLRPENTDSLFSDRARLVWDDNNCSICLHLPGVARNKLPATWEIGTLSKRASATPDMLALDSQSFQDSLLLKLRSDSGDEGQRIRGLRPFGLFDGEKNRFINIDMEQLPLRSYLLISPDKLDGISRKGFAEEDYPVNEPYELNDGATCYITRLWPIDRSATLTVGGQKLHFRANARIEMRFFAGMGHLSAHFTRMESGFKVERLPLLCVAVPHGYFKNAESEIKSKFQVVIDDGKEIQTYGEWKKNHSDSEREYFFWRWADNPISKAKPKITLTGLHQLKGVRDIFSAPDIRGKRTIYIKAPKLGIERPYSVEIVKPMEGMEACWERLPGAYLLWFLLSQPESPEGMKWDDLMLAKDAIASGEEIKNLHYRFKKYVEHRYLRQQGHTWKIAESRAAMKPIEKGLKIKSKDGVINDEFLLEFCGDPSVLWGLYRYILEQAPHMKLQPIEVITKRGYPPFIQMRWKPSQREKVEKYLKGRDVRMVSDLWEG
jgi:hypothetical protein